jgi:chromate transporter
VYAEEALFFSKTAMVTFGGAYSVLAYVAEAAVDRHGWLAPGEMLDGLGMAETTPGPLIQVVQFVGFMGAYRHPGELSPFAAGVAGSIITTWVTYVPCFLWIFLGAPYIEHLRGKQALNAALSTITAAVVGVILNLYIWFALHVIFATVDEQALGPLRLLIPDWRTIDPVAVAISIAAFVAMFRYKVGMRTVLAISSALGLAVTLLR